jgi:pimeloyl-ACP methyl ester carboxylesterase
MTAELKRHTTIASDGTPIAWYEQGQGAPILLAGGLLGRHAIWRPLWQGLDQHYRFVTWDYRGLWNSGRPSDVNRLSMECHVEDQRRTMEAAGAETMVLVGWSTGVQMNLEFYRRWPERVTAMVMICGTYGRAFEHALNWQGTQHVIPLAAQAAMTMQRLVSSTMGRLAGSQRVIRYLKLTGAVAPTADEEALRSILEELAAVDVSMFMNVVLGMEDQDATDLLGQVRVPVLVVSGQRDLLVPPRIARKMTRRLPDAELMVVPDGTHYTPLEFPDLMSLRIEKFLRDIRYGLRPMPRRGRRRR